ncbi:ABC transporter permease/M1 family aminopeptidase [Aquidulcibacter paucihalophilus]|uniref:ABC transporter permease/M1 family aminopeptidase n=1 Tax=Aquidulcibacter paucihalophilus TaxID=1978549 RepID=UPI000A196C3C|nr:M1 family aminopeptidase [Aquidulcibacter paucihalophilus]
MKSLRQFLSVAGFEFGYQLRNPVLWVSFTLFFLLTFGAVTVDEIQIGGTGNTNINSPFAINQTVMVMGIFALFAVTAFVANAVTRDDETGYGPILRATRLGKGAYLYGRFAGSWMAAAVGYLSVPLAILIGSFMPWLDQEKVGPLVLSHYAFAYFIIALPMLFVFGSMLFAFATATRSMMGAYLALIAILIAWVTTGVLFDKPELKDVAGLADPTGVRALFRQTEYWTAADRNTRLPELVGIFLQNRAIWLSVALAFLGLSFFLYRPGGKGVKADKAAKAGKAVAAPIVATAPVIAPVLTGQVRTAQLWARTAFDVKAVLFSPAFFVLLVLGLFNSMGALLFADEVRGTAIEPVTRLMVVALQSSFSIIPIIIAGFYAGDLVWRDRERRMAEIIDSTPVSDWAFVLPKVLAIFLVLLATNIVGMLAGMGVQLFKGYAGLEPMGYLLWWIVPSTVSGLQLAILAVFLQALSPNKYVGWGCLVVYLVASITLASMGFQHNLYNFGGSPATPLSAFNGMAHFWIGKTWFDLYWGAFCVVLVVLAYGLWRRGAETRLMPRIRRFPRRMIGATGLVLASAVAAFAGLGGWIFYNTNVLNLYQSSVAGEESLAKAEKALAQYEEMPGPKITDVKLTVNLRPKDRQADVTGSYVIENQTGAPLTRMIAVLPEKSTVERASLTIPGVVVEKAWPDYGTTLYRFETPMAPGEKRVVTFETVYGRKGFTNNRGQSRLIANGTFLNNFELTPVLGVSRGNWLTDRSKRRKYGLDPDRRPYKLEDPKGDAHHYLRPDSHWVNADITVSTDDDQIPIAPGYQVSEIKKDGRITRRFVTEAPIHHFFSIQSARYGVKRSQVLVAGKPVSVELYHHPKHTANLDRMEKAAHRSLVLFSERFSPYQFRQFRILEFPAYETFAQSFANTVPFSEDIGWLQANRDPKKIDLVTFVTAHEIAHQWFAHQFVGGDKQGSTMLSESFAQYGALLVMEDMLGPEHVRQFLKNELDSYLSARGSEVVEELPLNRVENQGYIHYNKGALVMYFLRNEVGEAPVNAAIRKMIAQFAFKPAPYPTSAQFIAFLREEVGPDPIKQQLITDLFEKITLYDAKVSSATKVKLPDGRWQVTATIEAKKLYADGEGKETEAPMSDAWEVGVFNQKPEDKAFTKANVLAFERRTIRSGRQQVVFTLPATSEPSFIGIDPYVKRIDRNSDDNLIAVEAGKAAQ